MGSGEQRIERAETVSTGGELELESRRKMSRMWGQPEGGSSDVSLNSTGPGVHS